MPKRNWETILRFTLVVTITAATFLYVRYSTEIKERERALEQYLATHYNISAETYSIDGTLSLSGYIYDLTFAHCLSCRIVSFIFLIFFCCSV